MGQLSEAKKGRITPEMREVAKEEGLEPEFIRDNLAQGGNNYSQECETQPNLL